MEQANAVLIELAQYCAPKMVLFEAEDAAGNPIETVVKVQRTVRTRVH